MKKILVILLAFIIFISSGIATFANIAIKSEAELDSEQLSATFSPSVEVGGAYLMEAKTGKVLYAHNEFSAASPASVTKVMTLLLVCEAIESGRIALTDMVTVSSHAASMGGSQVFLEEGERISVEELVKSTVIASGNDSAVALAELCAGSEAAFVKMMNKRAAELGLKNTAFENTTGLDDTTTNHYTCPADIAAMSRELIKHEIILRYSSIWQDTIRNGEFTLTNTNRLVRYYDGCNGLKTGSTDKAGYCISATAKRGNMQLIAVIMGARTRDERNQVARELLDFGFANFALYERGEEFVEEATLLGGKSPTVMLYSSPFSTVVDKGKIGEIELVYDIPEQLTAPVAKDDEVGGISYRIDGRQIGKSVIYPADSVDKITLGDIFLRIMQRILCG